MLAGTDPACMVLLVVVVTRTLPVPSVLAAVLAGDGITLLGHKGRARDRVLQSPPPE